MDDRRKLEIAGWALAAFVVVLLGARLLQGGAEARAVPVSVGGEGAPPGKSARGKQKLLVVDVDGEVRRPGLQRVPEGARAGVAVRLAGGMTARADAAAVNLAAPLADGQQVVVPRRGAAGSVAAAPGAVAGDPAAPGAVPAQPISLATATVAQLDTLDGIGPTLAGRIIEYRTEHGGFRSVDELKQVEGIGEARFETLREGVTP
jgi:competence protein ComEA